jgi:hypothetical protein
MKTRWTQKRFDNRPIIRIGESAVNAAGVKRFGFPQKFLCFFHSVRKKKAEGRKHRIVIRAVPEQKKEKSEDL